MKSITFRLLYAVKRRSIDRRYVTGVCGPDVNSQVYFTWLQENILAGGTQSDVSPEFGFDFLRTSSVLSPRISHCGPCPTVPLH